MAGMVKMIGKLCGKFEKGPKVDAKLWKVPKNWCKIPSFPPKASELSQIALNPSQI